MALPSKTAIVINFIQITRFHMKLIQAFSSSISVVDLMPDIKCITDFQLLEA